MKRRKKDGQTFGKKFIRRSAVVAQLVEQSLSMPEIRGSNPDFGNYVYYLSAVI